MEQENLNVENQTVETTEGVIDKNKETEQEVKTFTEEEVLKKVQSETDKVRTEYSKKIKEYETKIKELTPIEKSAQEIELEERIKALEDKEKKIQSKELELKVSETLENNGLPKQLSKYLNTIGVKDLESYLGEVKEILNSHLVGNAYKPKDHKNNKTSITKEQFKNMNLIERQKLYMKNKELYNKLNS